MSCFPDIVPLGTEGYLVRFSDRLDDAANAGVLAFAAELEEAALPGVREVSTSLASVFVRFERGGVARGDLVSQLEGLLARESWKTGSNMAQSRLWRVPTLYGGCAGPQLREAAALAGVSEEAAVEQLSKARVRVLALGFAPGQPYLGMLPDNWDIGRMSELAPRVPAGALVVAVRQFVLFANPSPTGWRQVALTKLPLFDAGESQPFTLSAGDELLFEAVSEHDFAALEGAALGGARCEQGA